jgi:hypothetical protein
MLKIKQGVDVSKYGFVKNKSSGFYFQQIGSNTNWLFVQVNDKNEIEFWITHDIATPDTEDYFDDECGYDSRGLDEKLLEISYGELDITKEFNSLLAKLIADNVIEN